MVSFSCEVCNDTILKKKLDQHRQRCPDAYFTCIDCSVTFSGTDYRGHTQCMSEAEKYEKSLYKGKKNQKPQQPHPKPQHQQQPQEKPQEKSESKSKDKKEKKAEKSEKPLKVEKPKKLKSKLDLTKYGDGSLYKILKNLASDSKKDKKELMKELKVKVDNGKVVLFL